jgi:hypothetical protein
VLTQTTSKFFLIFYLTCDITIRYHRGIVGTFHRPHPQKEAKPYQVRDVLKFLEMAGVIEYEHDEL